MSDKKKDFENTFKKLTGESINTSGVEDAQIVESKSLNKLFWGLGCLVFLIASLAFCILIKQYQESGRQHKKTNNKQSVSPINKNT